jgi:hypothetical protein
MSTQVGSLYASLTLQSGNFSSGLKQAQKETHEAESGIIGSFKHINEQAEILHKAMMTFGGLFLVEQAVEGVNKMLEFAASLKIVATQTGTTIEQYQILKRVGIEAGVSQDDMNVALTRMNKTLGDAQRGSESATKALKNVGIDPTKVHDAYDALQQFITHTDGVTSSQMKASEGAALMGRSYQKIAPMINMGSEAFAEYAHEAENSGLITDEQAEKAHHAEAAMATMADIMKTKVSGAIADNSSGIITLTALLGTMASAAIYAAGALGSWAHQRNETNKLFNPSRVVVGRDGQTDQQIAQSGATQLLATPESRTTFISDLTKQLTALKYDQSRSVDPHSYDKQIATTEHMRGTVVGADRKANEAAARAAAAAAGRNPEAGGADTNNDLASHHRNKGRTEKDNPEKAADEAAKRLAEFTNDMAQRQAQLSVALAELSGNTKERADAEVGTLQMDHDREARRIAGDSDLTAAQKAQTVVASDALTAAKIALVRQQERNDEAEQLASMAAATRKGETDMLSLQEANARTAGEKRVIELKLLDLKYEELRAQQQLILDTAKAGDFTTIANAKAALAAIPANKAEEAKSVKTNTAGPLEAYLTAIPKGAKEINEAFQTIATQGLESLNQGIVDAITGTKSLAASFSDMAKSIVADLLKIAIQQAVIAPLGNALSSLIGGLGGGIDTSSLNASTLSSLNASNAVGTASILGHAEGGNASAGGSYWVGERGPELFTPSNNGYISANDNSGGRSNAPTIHIDARGSTDPAETSRQIQHALAMYTPAILHAANGSTTKALARPTL